MNSRQSAVGSPQSAVGGSQSANGSSQSPIGSDLLETIVAATRRIVEVRQTREPLAVLAERAANMPSRLGVFQAALSRTDQINVIAECKRRSPSRGVLREDYDPVAIGTGYA